MRSPDARRLRILVADDEPDIQALYRAVLRAARHTRSGDGPVSTDYELTIRGQGEDAVSEVRASLDGDRPFALAFLDVRMPPGINGVEAARQIRELDPNIEIVIVTAYTDIDPDEIARTVPPAHRLLYLNKPFHPFEIRQLAAALTAKWFAEDELRGLLGELDRSVDEWTAALLGMEGAEANRAPTAWDGPLDEALLLEVGDLLAHRVSFPAARASLMALLACGPASTEAAGSAAAFRALARELPSLLNDPGGRPAPIARFGTALFLVALPARDRDQAQVAADRLMDWSARQASLPLEVGIAVWDPASGRDIRELPHDALAQLDAAMEQ
ncbi:MAG: response regulator [Armatimonadia bacterium]|nr:response regulator [Armatimonadia bacterium]